MSLASSWKVPYGVTFPGKPAGRFSDGRVLTDYFARFVGIKSPIAYRWRKYGGDKVRFGMNFAVGGTGVFQTLTPGPNMTTQIGSLQQLLKDSVYSAADLGSAVALVSLAGNDYGPVLAKNVTVSGLRAFIPHVAVAKLNLEAQRPSFIVLNLHASFISVIGNKTNFRDKYGLSKFGNPLKPCCVWFSKEYSCGSLDKQGTKMYKVCKKPDSAFFWDDVHPTQAAWNAVFSTLRPSLQQIWT